MVEYRITVVDAKWDATPYRRRKAPDARGLVEVGVPLRVAAEWKKVRAEMSPAGLKKKAHANRN